MSCDSALNRLVVFGGFRDTVTFNDTWSYDLAANTWTDLSPEGAFALREMGYVPRLRCCERPHDHVRRRVQRDLGLRSQGEHVERHHSGGNLAFPREDQSMVYEPSSGQMIMFGGFSSTEGDLGDTWVFTP